MSFKDSIAVSNINYSPEQFIRNIKFSSLKFYKAEGNRVNFGFVSSEYHFIILKLYSAIQLEDFYLSIDNTSLDTISIFKVNNNLTSTLLCQEGNLIPFKKSRNYVWHTTPLEIGKVPSYYLIALKASQKNINVRYDILKRVVLQRNYEIYQRYVFLYIGMIVMIALAMLLAFFLFRKMVFLFYLGYSLCTAGWIFTHYGMSFSILFPDTPLINEVIKPLFSLGAGIFLMLVLLKVFGSNWLFINWFRKAFKTIFYMLLLITGIMLFLLIPKLSEHVKITLIVAWQVGLISSIFIIVFTPIYFFKSGSTAKIFSAAMLIICIMSIVQQIANLGYIQSFFLNEHGITMASLLEISIMAFGLIYSFLKEKKEKEKQVMELELERTETLKQLITVQDNERKRIAADLHDNLGPLLSALKINFRRIINNRENQHEQLIEKTESIIDDSISEIRNVAHNLMPKGLSVNGLINTLTDYFDGLQQLYDKKILFDHKISSTLNPELQINLYRIICELVMNAARHSKAKIITVCAKTENGIITVCILDDGQGFIQNKNGERKTLGLQSAESRVIYMKGAFNLKTEKNKGTLIDIEIPLQFDKPHVNGF